MIQANQLGRQLWAACWAVARAGHQASHAARNTALCALLLLCTSASSCSSSHCSHAKGHAPDATRPCGPYPTTTWSSHHCHVDNICSCSGQLQWVPMQPASCYNSCYVAIAPKGSATGCSPGPLQQWACCNSNSLATAQPNSSPAHSLTNGCCPGMGHRQPATTSAFFTTASRLPGQTC